MIDLETKNWISSEGELNSQIFCVTVDVALDLVIRNSSSEFMSNLKYIVFDEVHLKDVSDILWRLCYMNRDIQFILLSATLGNAYDLKDELRKYRKNPIK